MPNALPVPAARRSARVPGLALLAAAGLAFPALAQVNPLQPDAPPPQRPGPGPGLPPPPEAQAPQPSEDGPAFPISAFNLRYRTDHPDLPPIDDLASLEVTLGEANGVYVAPRPGAEPVTISLQDLTGAQRAPRRFSVSAINAIGARIVSELNRRGIIGVLVAPDTDQIDPQSLADRRPQGLQTLNLDIWTRTVSQVRTLGAGQRWSRPTARGDRPSTENRIDHRVHDRIRENSPLQPGVEGRAGDLLRRDLLDDYLYRLNRHPGRRVDAAIAAGETPGEVVLDYIVTENRPWTVYFQLSNTGTEQTDEWRQRVGFIHNQLLSRDDTLTLDFITASLDEANAIVASYDAPVGGSQVLRWKVYGSASEFTASDVGLSDEEFKGDSLSAGAEISLNVWQRRQAFVDIFGGARWERHHVENEIVDVEGETDFFLPYIGVRFERQTVKSNWFAEARLETTLDIVGTDDDEAERLGRIFVDEDWTVFKWNVGTSFYIEPLIFGEAWSNPSSPYRQTTLAHEVAVSFRGQNAFGNRLIPQAEDVLGGLYTVRGYPESLAAGDNSVVFSAEYRFHLPRILAIEEDPSRTPLFGRPFRFRPDQRYGMPDWDLILRGFFDVGRVTSNDRQTFEENETLAGAGLGLEFVFKRNLSLRLDWGVALRDARDTDAGDNRLHFVGTILY